MYDHLPPRLAKYLAAIYTGTYAPEIERQDTESIIEAEIKAWSCFTKLLRWNKQRGQKINQLNQRIHEQRLQMRELNRQLEFQKHRTEVFVLLAVSWQKEYFKVSRWNNAHKREIAQLQAKLHDRRVEVKRLQKQIDVFNCLLERKNQRLDDLVGALYSERRRARELRAFARETTRKLTDVATDASETFIEHDSDWEFK